MVRAETAKLDVPYLAKEYLLKDIDPASFQDSTYSSLPDFEIDLPLFNSLNDPPQYIKKLLDFQNMSMLQYTTKIDSNGKVKGSCEITSHGVCC